MVSLDWMRMVTRKGGFIPLLSSYSVSEVYLFMIRKLDAPSYFCLSVTLTFTTCTRAACHISYQLLFLLMHQLRMIIIKIKSFRYFINIIIYRLCSWSPCYSWKKSGEEWLLIHPQKTRILFKPQNNVNPLVPVNLFSKFDQKYFTESLQRIRS